MASLDNMEEDDEAFYYEVEEIVQMFVTESGVRMFEIKWKNYDSSYTKTGQSNSHEHIPTYFYRANTYEPEHNLNCPEILQRFLERNNFAKTTKKKKRATKYQSQEEEDEALQAEVLRIKARSQKNYKETSDSNQDTSDGGKKNGSNQAGPSNPKDNTFASKGNNNDHIESNTKKKPAMDEAVTNKKSKGKERATITEDDDSSTATDADDGMLLMQKMKIKKRLADESTQSNENRKERKRLSEEALQKKEKRKKIDREADKETLAAERAAERKRQENARAEETERRGRMVAERMKELHERTDRKKQEELAKKVASAINQVPASNVLKQTNGIHNSEESFTNIRRTTATNTNAAPILDISTLVGQIRNDNNSPSYPKPQQRLPFRNTVQQPPVHQLPRLQSKPQSPPQIQQHQISQQPGQLQPTPTASMSVFPSIPSPQMKTQPISRNGNADIVPAFVNTMQLPPDPRLRQHTSAQNQPPQQNVLTETVEPVPLEATVIKHTGLRDPRKQIDNVKRWRMKNSMSIATPFETGDLRLYNGDRYVASIVIEGKKHCFHQQHIRNLIENKEVRIQHTLSLRGLDIILKDRPISSISIIPKDHIVDCSKLRSFYQVNEIAGISNYSAENHQAIVLLAESDLKKLTNLNQEFAAAASSQQLCGLFIDDLPLPPSCLVNNRPITYTGETQDPNSPFAWVRVAEYLKFPAQLTNLFSCTKFVVYGNSDTATVLIKTVQLQSAATFPKGYVMMFDRYNDILFSKAMTKHKKEASTQIWEFGVPDYSYGEMIPARQVFPNNSGGFITTDMANIVHNPAIIDTISAEIEKFHEFPTIYGEWTFILPHNWLHHMKQCITDSDSAKKVQAAVVAIAIALGQNRINILKLWCAEQESISHVQYMDRVAHDKYENYQYFVYVDDINSIQPNEHLFSIDFVQSSRIFSSFV